MRVVIIRRYGKGEPIFTYQNTGTSKKHLYRIVEHLFDYERLSGCLIYEQPLSAYVKLVIKGYVRLSQFVFIMLKPV